MFASSSIIFFHPVFPPTSDFLFFCWKCSRVKLWLHCFFSHFFKNQKQPFVDNYLSCFHNVQKMLFINLRDAYHWGNQSYSLLSFTAYLSLRTYLMYNFKTLIHHDTVNNSTEKINPFPRKECLEKTQWVMTFAALPTQKEPFISFFFNKESLYVWQWHWD